jgi:hypothetical protein
MAPSISFSSQWESLLLKYEALRTSSSRKLALYSEISLLSRQWKGTCTDLNNFYTDTLSTLQINYLPGTLTLVSIEDNELLTSDHLNWSPSSSVLCDEEKIPQRVIQAIGTAQLSKESSQSDLMCNNHTWTVVKCASNEQTVLCVDCVNYCSLTLESKQLLPFVLSCTDPSPSPIGKAVILDLELVEKAPPPGIISMTIVPNARSCTIQMTLSTEGFVVCAAYESNQNYRPASTPVLLNSNRLVSANTSRFVEYHIEKLFPSTDYDLYCSTSSLSGMSMIPSQLWGTKRMFTTQCCRNVQVTLTQITLSDTKDIPSALQIALDVLPTNQLTVLINATSLSSGESFFPFQPSLFVFGAGNPLTTASFTYVHLPVGNYQLNVAISGPSAAKYFLPTAASATAVQQFEVLGTESEPSPPKLKSIQFSSDGSFIQVKFVYPTNRGRSTTRVSCSVFFTSLSLSQSALCVWMDSLTINIFNSKDQEIQLNELITLKTGVLKSECTSLIDPSCGNWKSNEEESLPVSSPLSGATPVVLISAPAQIGPCDTLLFDLTPSTGFGGRSWKSFTLTVSSPEANLTSLRSYLKTITSVNRPFPIPPRLFSSGSVYNFGVTLCNFLGFCGTGTKVVMVTTSQGNTPVAFLDTRSSFSVFR